MALKLKLRGPMLYVWGNYKGVTVRRSTGWGPDRTDVAEAQRVSIVKAIDDGTWGQPGVAPSALEGKTKTAEATEATEATTSEVRLGDVMDAYLAKRQDLDRSTVRLVQRMKGEVGATALREVDRKWANEVGERWTARTSVGSSARMLRQLRAVLNWWRAEEDESYVPPRFVIRDDVEGREVYLSKDETEKVLAWLWEKQPLYAGFFEVMVFTGARPIELCRLSWSDVDLGRGTLKLKSRKGKGGVWRTRTLPMHERVRKVLEAKAHRLGPVFVTLRGTAWGNPRHLLERPWRKVRRALGLGDVVPYDLRHTFASWLREQGHDLDTIRKLLGHSNIMTTMRYAHVGDEELRKAVEGL